MEMSWFLFRALICTVSSFFIHTIATFCMGYFSFDMELFILCRISFCVRSGKKKFICICLHLALLLARSCSWKGPFIFWQIIAQPSNAIGESWVIKFQAKPPLSNMNSHILNLMQIIWAWPFRQLRIHWIRLSIFSSRAIDTNELIGYITHTRIQIPIRIRIDVIN